MNLLEYAGKFHPLAVHLPIGILVLFCIVAILIDRKELINAHKIVRLWILVGAVTATFASISGYLLSTTGSYGSDLVDRHMILGFTLTAGTWILWFALPVILGSGRMVFNVAIAAIFIVLIFTGHAGGSLTHGEDFLTPPPITSWFSGRSSEEVKIRRDMAAGEVALLIFEQKCISCHGSSKQKGDLRLDSEEAILTGGESGRLFDDDPAQSHLLERIHLLLDDDDHMPPKERKQLSQDELDFLSWWIINEAKFDETLQELNFPDSINGLLNSETEEPVSMYVPEQQVKPADDNALIELENLGVAVYPVAENSNYLSVHFLNVLPENADQALQNLENISDQLVWLRLDYQQVNEESWQSLGLLDNLRKLSLKNTNVTDQYLSALASMKGLRQLNLVGTDVTMEGLKAMGNHPDLQHLFLYQTYVGQSDYPALSNLFPSAQIDTGNYKVPILESDTTVLRSKQ